MEGYVKAVIEHFKRINALSSGFLAMLVALSSEWAGSRVWSGWLAVSFGSFALAIMFSLGAQLYFVDLLRGSGDVDDPSRRVRVLAISCWMSFMLGVVGLVMFGARNFVR